MSQKHDIRVVTMGDDPWFVAADVAKVLGLPNITVTLKSKYIDPKEKATTVVGHRTVNIISESGLYRLIMRSDKQQAKAFQDWVTREVLPAIRKDGAYVQGEEKLKSGEMSEDEFVMKAMTILQGKVARITKERDEAIADLGAAHKTIGHSQHTISRFGRTLLGVNTQKTNLPRTQLGTRLARRP
jgi:prophage antirepressor-like protein